VPQVFVKSPVFPFNKFPGVDPALAPEMRSTGEVMGVGDNFGEAFLKAQISAGTPLPEKGTVFISVKRSSQSGSGAVARRFAELGFIWWPRAARRPAARRRAEVQDRFQGERRPAQRGGSAERRGDPARSTPPPARFRSRREGHPPQRGHMYRVPCITTMSGARAAAEAVAARQRDPIRVWSLQEIHGPG
jgi:carbamoyl-phosphate synthase large subunit